ncbi:MAG: hypothetical protein NUW00_04235 [Candidatus Kaiserbacteria bacterium]|nr:hypothetical protein [Candidatus Kaiserbacteria bacterium]
MSKVCIAVFACVTFLSFAPCTSAQTKQVLSVTPPLFQISALPGDVWQSSVKAVNGNPYPLTVYAEVVNFEATGEGGQGKFTPIPKDLVEKTTLADWIVINNGPIVIPPEQTTDITFFADVPKNAAPGGHYAAIMISTEEPKGTGELAVLASQAVTSLLFLRVEGDVDEVGTIREFSLRDSFLDTPNAEFILRFENKGNVHLQPRGEIVISNMWGTERGTIPINYQTQYGNVLPKSIRNFSFSWSSDFRVTDIGRYKAEVTLAYGSDGIKSVSAISYFWVIPVKWTLITLGALAFIIWLIVLMVRAYVRRMLELAGVPVRQGGAVNEPAQSQGSKTKIENGKQKYATVSAPIRDGVLDLRKRLTTTEESLSTFATVMSFVVQYKKFFLSVIALICIFIAIVLYVGNAVEGGKGYEVIIGEGDSTTTLTDEDVRDIQELKSE